MNTTVLLKKADDNLPKIQKTIIKCDTSPAVLDKGDSITVDLGNHYVGYFSFKMWYVEDYIDAPVTLRVRFFETKGEMDFDYSEYNGWLCESWIQEDTVKIDFPGVFSLPRRYAARYVKLEVVHTPRKLSLSDFTFAAETSADESKLLPYTTDDALLHEIDRVAVNTLKNCMQRVFEDGPKRDRRLWIGDLRLEALANYYTFRDTSLVKRCLYLFAAAERNSLGFLPAYVYENPIYVTGTWHIVDYSMMYVNTLCDYLNHIGDREVFDELYPLVREIMDSANSQLDKDGILVVPEEDMFIDWCAGLKKVAAHFGVYLYTLQNLVTTLSSISHPDGEVFGQRLEKGREDARRIFFDSEKSAFINARDENQYSVHTSAWMVLAGVVEGELAKKVMSDVLDSEDSIKPFTPYMHHYTVEALFKAGLTERALEYIRWIWGGMVEVGTDTFFEAYVPGDPAFSPYDDNKVNSMCHAWSCTATYFLRKYGIK
jgi:alpha-L-rhamnosidase